MPLRIEREDIWKRLQTRFKARSKTDTDPDDPEHPILLETVQPVTIADELLKRTEILRVSADLSGGGDITLWTIPDGERWTLVAFYKPTSVGTVYSRLHDASAAQWFPLKVGAAGVQTTLRNELDIQLEEKDYIYAGNGNVADAAIVFKAIVTKEDAY